MSLFFYFKSVHFGLKRNTLHHFIDILSYLEKQSKQAPRIVKNSVLVRIQAIRANPFICEIDKLKENTNNEFCALVVFSYRVTYQIKTDAKEIRILRIRHTSREPIGY